MKFILLSLSLFSLNFIFGQAGIIDTTFNILHQQFLNGQGPDGFVQTSSVQTDGKILFGGSFNNFSEHARGHLVRVNPNGGLDETFDPGNILIQQQGTVVNTIAVKSDGKILVGGTFNVWGQQGNSAFMTQLNSDGTIDQLNNGLTSVTEHVYKILLQPDGKILVAGSNNASVIEGGTTRYHPFRLNSDGTIDPSFDAGSGANNNILDMVLQPDGKVIIVGLFTNVNGVNASKIARLNADGTLDNTFTVGVGVDYHIKRVKIQPDGKLIIVGSFTTFNGQSKNGIVRLNSDGTIDNTFISGIGIFGIPSDAHIQGDGKIVLVGSISGYNGISGLGNILRVFPDGTIDPMCQTIQGASASTIHINQTSSNNLIITGSFTTVNDKLRSYFVCLNNDLSIDSSFYIRPGANSTTTCIKELPDGKLLLAGDFFYYNDQKVAHLIRILPDGTRDSSFNTDPFISQIKDIKVQPDGKILVGGKFFGYGFEESRGILRLNSDGTFDSTFNVDIGTNLSGFVYSISLLLNGQIIIGGDFNTFNGITHNNLIRLNADGSVDNNFNLGSGFNDRVFSVCSRPNGKIYVGGVFTQFNGDDANRIICLSMDGSVDSTFVIGIGCNNSVSNIKCQADEKILVSGGYSQYNGLSTGSFMRLNVTGEIDSTFISSFTSGGPNDFFIQPDNKIIVAGNFVLNGQVTKLARIYSNGLIDSTFTRTIDANAIKKIDLKSNGQIMLVGTFSTVQGKYTNHTACINNDVLGFSNLSLSFSNFQNISCTSNGTVTAQANNGFPPYTIEWDNFQDSLNPTQTITTPGVYTCTVSDSLGHSITVGQIFSAPTPLNGYDLKVNLVHGSFRPGFESQINLNGFNNGCIPTSGELIIVLDTLLDYVSANPMPTNQIGDSLIWNFINLAYDSIHIQPQIIVQTNVAAQIGDTIDLLAIITPILGDYNTLNNVKSYISPVINGYDPNDKAVYPIGKCDDAYILDDQILTYTIRFQNTGNSEAINIVVVDSIDSDLDINTTRIVANSHEMWSEVINGNVLTFHFDSILLPDSTTNESASHGYVIFEISPIAGSFHNTEIKNGSQIYFDYNPAVYTNTVINSIYQGDLTSFDCSILEINEEYENKIILYPNPTGGILTIDFGSSVDFKMILFYDLQGNEVLRKEIVDNRYFIIDLSFLSSGVYIVNVDNTNYRVIRH